MADKNSTVYIIRLFNENEVFYKIGMTQQFKRRMCKIRQSKYNIYIEKLYEGLSVFDALKLENKLQDNNIDYRYNPLNKFGGYLECFYKINELMDII